MKSALTAALLQAADSKPVKTCRACHLQAGDDSAPIPTVTYPDKPAPAKLTNEVAYHTNCNICHDKAIAARPALKGKFPARAIAPTATNPLAKSWNFPEPEPQEQG